MKGEALNQSESPIVICQPRPPQFGELVKCGFPDRSWRYFEHDKPSASRCDIETSKLIHLRTLTD